MKRLSMRKKRRRTITYIGKKIVTNILLTLFTILIPCMVVMASTDLESIVRQVADANLSNYDIREIPFSDTDMGIDTTVYECQGFSDVGEVYFAALGPLSSEAINKVSQIYGEYYVQTAQLDGCEVKEYGDDEAVGVSVILKEYFILVAVRDPSQISYAKNLTQQMINGIATEGLLNQEVPIIIDEPAYGDETQDPSVLNENTDTDPLNEPLPEETDQESFEQYEEDYDYATDNESEDNYLEEDHHDSKSDLDEGIIDIEVIQDKIRDGVNNFGTMDNVFEHSHTTDTVAGVGSVGNIPGPDNAVEAAAGVIVPGIIATALSALGALGGTVPPIGEGPLSGMGGAPNSGVSPQTGNSYNPITPVTAANTAYTAQATQTNLTNPASPGVQTTVGTGPGILINTSILDGNSGAQQQETVPETTPPDEYNAEGFNAEGFDRDGFNREGFDAQGFNRDGFNKYGFDREGFDADGYDGNGFNKEGFNREGFDENGFDINGYDLEGFDKEGFSKEGLDKEGFNKEGFDLEGFNKEGFDKEGFDKNGFDEEGFNKEGFNKEGFDKEGFNKEGFDKEGFNKEGFDKEGFNKEGFDKEGFNKEGFDKGGFNKEGFDKGGFNKEGFDKEGFNKEGFDKEGFNKEGFDKEGFDKEGFNKEGFNKEGFDKEGYNGEGFNKEGLDREGFNQDGFDQEGFNREGFNQEGFDKQGYDQEGFDKEGFDREGYNKEGFNQEGLDKEGYDKKGYNNKGLDKEGFDKEGYNKEGYNKDGFNRDGYNQNGYDKNGFDKKGYDKKGYDKEGYNREGYDKDGMSRDGYDGDGYNKKGFNKDGYDKDGYDLEGFDYKGYNRSGYDPWGYDRQGYGRDGYHWSGYDADGYDRNGKHWTGYQKPTDGGTGINTGAMFDVDHSVDATASTPFTTAKVNITHSVSTPKTNFDDDVINSVKQTEPTISTEPPLGKPYPKTDEKYGLHKWDDPKQNITSEDTIVTDQPQNPTPSVDDVRPAQPQEPAPPVEDVAPTQPQEPSNTFEYTDPNTGAGTTYEYDPNYTGPGHGDTRILTGSTDGRTYEIEYNAVEGQWINKESGNYFDPDRFDGWQADLAKDRKFSDEFFEKAAIRREEGERAYLQREAEKRAGLDAVDRLQKVAGRNFADEKGGVGDVISHLDKMKKDLENGEGFDTEQFGKIYRVMEGRLSGRSDKDMGERHVENWADTMNYAKESAMATSREVMTGKKADGSTSWLGIGAKAAITVGAAVMTGGTSLAATASQKAAFFAIDGAMNVAEAMYVVKDSIDKGERGEVAFLRASGNFILNEGKSQLIGEAGKAVIGQSMKHFPNFTTRTMDKVQTALLKGQATNIKLSGKVGLMSAKQTSKALDEINRELVKIGGKSASGKVHIDTSDIAGSSSGKTNVGIKGKAPLDTDVNIKGKVPTETDVNIKSKAPLETDVDVKTKNLPAGFSNPEDYNRIQNTMRDKVKDFDYLGTPDKNKLMNDQMRYEEYVRKAEQNATDMSDKLRRGDDISVEDISKIKADPKTTRIMKKADLADREAFNRVQDSKIHQPTYKDTMNEYTRKTGKRVTMDTVRTPGKKASPGDINTDNDVVMRNLDDGTEIPKAEWEGDYNKFYAKHTNYSDEIAKKRFPNDDWDHMDEATKYKKWAEHHEETPMDRFDKIAANDFSDQKVYGGKSMIEATQEEIDRGVDYVVIDGKNMRNSTSFELTTRGQGILKDADQLGMMEKTKFNEYWNAGTTPKDIMRNQSEALEQLKKTCNAMEKLECSYKNMGYSVKDMPQNMRKAIDVIGDNSLAPSVRAQRLKDVGYATPDEFIDRITSRIGALKIAKK